MYSTTDFKKGLKIEINNEPFNIVEFQHVKPGKGNAFVRTRLKSLISGNVLERTFKSGEKVDKPDLENKKVQFLYEDGEIYHFMDMETFEQLEINSEKLGDATMYMMEQMETEVLYYKGEPIDIELPTFIEVNVVQTDPGLKGDTVSGATKPAVIETGATIQVPLFLNENERIKVDTRTGTYVERVKG
ncbi:MAG: elongation factor P [Deltaproteobacteria bacterium]|nr:MAG: elongation factor P [Deltaproteobacteria bacterium]